MTNEQLIEKINSLLIEEFEVNADQIIPGANLKEALELDSLDYIDMVVVLEHHFGFKVKPEDFAGIETLQDFYDYVTNRMNTKALV